MLTVVKIIHKFPSNLSPDDAAGNDMIGVSNFGAFPI
jgi:hypothetical protein